MWGKRGKKSMEWGGLNKEIKTKKKISEWGSKPKWNFYKETLKEPS